MKFAQLTERAAQQKPLRLDVVAASPVQKTALKEWEKRGWTINSRAGDVRRGGSGRVGIRR